MKSKTREFFGKLPFLPRALRLVWQATGRWTVIWLILLVVQGTLPAANVYLIRPFVDSLSETIGSGSWQSLQPALFYAALIGAVMLLSQLLKSANDWIDTVQAELVQDYLAGLIHDKSVAVDMAFYETPDFHDHLHRARDDAGHLPLSVLESLGNLLQNSVTLLAMGAVLLPYGMWLPLILVLSTLPAFYVILRNHARYHDWWEQTTADRRWAQYYDLVLTLDETASELRLFGLEKYFKDAYQTIRQQLREELWRVMWKQNLARLSAAIFAMMITAVAGIWMIWQAMLGTVTLGDLALMYQAFNQGQGLLRSTLGSLGQLYRHLLFLSNLFEFLDLESKVVDPLQPQPVPPRLTEGIRFNQVTFRYPGNERVALQGFNLTIPVGKTTAIVGANGAGKSTLVKLLCRFYDPEAGAIELDGINLRQFSLRDFRSRLAVMFQSPVPYHASAANNIAVGNWSRTPGMTDIEQAARGAGAHDIICSLPRGYETLLGKWFVEGTGLSGGEWQRIALARAFLRKSEIVVLDEPTSAMDSWAETEWLNRFRGLVKERTAIIITHRFTTAMRADIIHVMDKGQIVETGSHDELLAKSGLYAQSWLSQMRATTDQLSKTPSGPAIAQEGSKRSEPPISMAKYQANARGG